MDANELKVLLDKRKFGKLTQQEAAILDSWYLSLSQSETVEVDQDAMVRRLDAVWNSLEVNEAIKLKARKIKLLRRGIPTAAAVAAITLGVWLYYSSNTSRHAEFISASPNYANDVAPGKNTATLTLANGKVINLDTNKTSVIVADSVKNMTMLTASTPRGGTYQVVLPDGTKVWLNADSKISFPSQFIGKERKVVLEGEAYFAVVHNAKQPFKVESRGQVVEDIGTEFNISAYAEESSVKTTLVEGEAAVNGTILKPNQQAILKGEALQVKEIDPATAVDWKQGEFVFKNEDFKTAMRRIARWYDVEIVYQNEKPITLDPRGWVSRSSNISSVLKMIESTGDVHFKIEGRRIIVTN